MRLVATVAAVPALAAVMLIACAGAGPGSRAFRWSPSVKPAAYFPLAVGTAWSYDAIDPGSGRSVLVVSRVQSRIDGRAILTPEPDLLAYEDLGDRILSLPSRKPVLLAPIEKSAHWPLPDGGTATITAIDAVVDTGAGRYAGCVVVEESAPDRRIVTIYAPSVGPVRLEIYAREGATEVLVSKAVLRSYHAADAEAP